MKLQDRVALITGGGSGIGEATALLFAGEGAKLALCDLREENVSRVAKDIADKGGKSRYYLADVSSEEQVQGMVAKVVSDFGRLDILINNAGITRDALVRRMKEEQWNQVIDINLKGSFLCAKTVSFPMAEQKYGKINNTSSIGSLGNIGQANYAASKAGVIGLTKTLALELARFNINVNCVAPGATLTPMTAAIPKDIAERYKEKIPLKRFADPKEVAYVHLFLASVEASYITGQVIFVDGGVSVGF
ncbi:MAG: beta-ketoacyl-ACP reductase [Thermodesulfobacteriota bacterium]